MSLLRDKTKNKFRTGLDLSSPETSSPVRIFMKRTILAVLLITALCFSFACERRNGSGTNAVDSGGEIVVGYYGDLTGRTASFGQSTRNGVEMAIDEINQAGG